MKIIRNLFFFLVKRNVNITLEHVYGYNNSKADALSRFQVHRFQEMAPHAEIYPEVIPPEIWDIC